MTQRTTSKFATMFARVTLLLMPALSTILPSSLLSGCGPADSALSSTASETGAGTTEGDKPAGSTASCLAGNCTLVSGTSFDFASQFDVTPSGCTMQDLALGTLNGNIAAISRATCGSQPQVYLSTFTPTGDLVTGPTLLSSSCSGLSNGVSYLTIARADSGIGIVYVCRSSISTYSYQYAARFLHVSSPTLRSTDVAFDTQTSFYRYNASWNDTAGVYGLMRGGKFWRVNKSASLVAGATTISTGTAAVMRVINGNWHLLQSSSPDNYFTADSATPYAEYCSKISPQGVLQCDAVSLGSGNRVRTPIADDRLLSNANDYNSNTLKVSSFTAATCAASAPVATEGQVRLAETTNNRIFTSARVGTNLAGVLLTDNNVLSVLTVSTAGNPAIYVLSPVMNFATMTGADMLTVGDKVYVAGAVDGQGRVAIGAAVN